MKSHFKFTRQTRNGIFVLLVILISVQAFYWFYDFSDYSTNKSSEDALAKYRKEVDSLRQIALQEKAPKIYPFNPNFITDYKGYTLGMSNEEIDRLLKYRKKNQWVNSAKQFQQVTKVSDSLLNTISPYFKFPEWVNNPKPNYNANSYNSNSKPKSFAQKIDLNIATAKQLQKVYGVGEKLSANIIKYRDKQGGFVSEVELSEIWDLTPEVIERISEHFVVKTPRKIQVYNLNSATRDQLVLIPHIDYEIASNIIEERTLREGFLNIEDLTKVEQFPVKKIEIIKLYLSL